MSRHIPAEALSDTVRELAGDADLRLLWQAVHERLCAGTEPAELATVTVTGLPAGGVAILRTWLDTSTRRRRGTSAVPSTAGVTRVPLRELLRRFDVAVDSLPAIAEFAVDRPVLNRSAARRAGKDARAALWSTIEADLALVPCLAARIRAAGVADDDIPLAARQAHQIGSALSAIDGLRRPGVAPMTLAKLAHDHAHDPHGFDLDRISGQRLVEAVAEMLCEAVPTRPDAVRALLARAGVLADRLSSTVLVLNVSASGTGPVDERLRIGGGPSTLTLYDLTVHPPAFVAEPSLLVVENPSVLEAAMAIGYAGALACTSGHLRAVDHAFLQRAVDCDITLHYAGDIDRDGLIIARHVEDLYGATLVGMNEDVVANAGSHPSDVALGILSTDVPAGLCAVLSAHGRAIYQENDAVLRVLLS